MSKTGTERFNEAKRQKRIHKNIIKKVKDDNIRCQLFINMAKGISKDIHKYKLVERTKAVLVTKKHLAENIEIYSCPECEEIGIKLWMFFCPTCGVKIEWSKECKGKG